MKGRGEGGFTLVELMTTFSVSAIVFAAILGAFLTVKSVNNTARHRMQAMEIVRSRVEQLKRTTLNCIPDESHCDDLTVVTVSSTVSYDAGADGTFGTSDDLQGTLTTALQDGMDMDNDGNSTETAVDVNSDGTNDIADAKPVRVTFSWSQKVYGQTKTYSVFVDTLISA